MIFDNYNKAKVIKQYVLDTNGASYFEEDDVLQSGNSVANLNPVFIRRGRDEKVVYQVDAFLLLRRSAEGSSQISERVELIPGYKTVTYA